jgi:hypothetical protein
MQSFVQQTRLWALYSQTFAKANTVLDIDNLALLQKV